jgi:hypothetical protein
MRRGSLLEEVDACLPDVSFFQSKDALLVDVPLW